MMQKPNFGNRLRIANWSNCEGWCESWEAMRATADAKWTKDLTKTSYHPETHSSLFTRNPALREGVRVSDGRRVWILQPVFPRVGVERLGLWFQGGGGCEEVWGLWVYGCTAPIRKHPPPEDPPRTLGMVLRYGLRGVSFLMNEVPL